MLESQVGSGREETAGYDTASGQFAMMLPAPSTLVRHRDAVEVQRLQRHTSGRERHTLGGTENSGYNPSRKGKQPLFSKRPDEAQEMPWNLEDSPLALDRPNTARHIRDVLDRADFTEARIRQVLHAETIVALHLCPQDFPRVWHWTRGGTPLDTLIRLFLCGGSTNIEAARRAVQPMALEEWAEAGLVRLEGSAVIGTVGLLPCQGLVLAWDALWFTRPTRNSVMGVGGTSLVLAQLTVRQHARLTLDLCSGGGIQALLASPHSDRVLGVDANPRAVNLAAFNAQLNGIANARFLQGNLLEPVEGQAFDLVVANPPYIISPEMVYLLRDSGLPRDGVTEHVVRAVPRFLQEGGYAHILCHWAHLAGQDWRQRLAGWVARTGCDAWVLRFGTVEPAQYADDWIWTGTAEGQEAFARHFEAWMAYFEREGIEAINLGLVTLRRATGRPNWFRCDDSPRLAGPCGAAVERGFALCDFLEAVKDDAALLDARLAPAPELEWQQEREPNPQGWSPTASRLRLRSGLAYARTANGPVLDLVGRCRGGSQLRQVLTELGTAQGLDMESTTPVYLKIVRRLVEQGFLVPAGLFSGPG